MLIRMFVLGALIECLSAIAATGDAITASNFPANLKSTNGWQEIAVIAPW